MTSLQLELDAARKSKCSSWLGPLGQCFDDDKIITFIRDIRLSGMTKIEKHSKQNHFVAISFELTSKPNRETWDFTTDISDTNSWSLGQNNLHFSTSFERLRTHSIVLRVYDKIKHMGDCFVGKAAIKLADLITAYDEEVVCNFQLMNRSAQQTGWGWMSFIFAKPFSFSTCGISNGCKFVNCSTDEVDGRGCFSVSSPSCANCQGCLYEPTCGTFHLPTGEKCFECHAPNCSACDITKPSLVNLGGVLLCDICAGESKGTFGNLVDCGHVGIPSCSFPCACHECGNYGFCPWNCKMGYCHCCPGIHTDYCTDPLGALAREEISFEKGSIHLLKARVLDNAEGSENPFIGKTLEFHLSLGQHAHTNWSYSSQPSATGEWLDLEKAGLFVSSKTIASNNFYVNVHEHHSNPKQLNSFGSGPILASGNVSLRSLLIAGYHQDTSIVIPLLSNSDYEAACIFEILIVLKSDSERPNDQVNTSSERRKSVSAFHPKRASVLMDIKPDVLQVKLTGAHFESRPDINLTTAEVKAIVKSSCEDEGLIVGYLVEIFSTKVREESKGIWVIMGFKKFRFSSTQYLLRNKLGETKWRVLEKEGFSSGKPFVLKRKVATF